MEVEKEMLIGAVWYQARIAVAFSKFIAGNILYKAIYIKGARDPSAFLSFNDLLAAYKNTTAPM